MSDEDLEAEIERLRIENAALKKGATAGLMKEARRELYQFTVWAAFP